MKKFLSKLFFWNKKSPVLLLLEGNGEYNWIKSIKTKHFYSYKPMNYGGNNLHLSWPYTDVTDYFYKTDKKSFCIHFFVEDVKFNISHRAKFMDDKIIILDYINLKFWQTEKFGEYIFKKSSEARSKSPLKTGMEFEDFKKLLEYCKAWVDK